MGCQLAVCHTYAPDNHPGEDQERAQSQRQPAGDLPRERQRGTKRHARNQMGRGPDQRRKHIE